MVTGGRSIGMSKGKNGYHGSLDWGKWEKLTQ